VIQLTELMLNGTCRLWTCGAVCALQYNTIQCNIILLKKLSGRSLTKNEKKEIAGGCMNY